MQQHNPHSHSIFCPAVGESLAAFATRELDAEQTQLTQACLGCGCRRTENPSEDVAAPARKRTAKQAE